MSVCVDVCMMNLSVCLTFLLWMMSILRCGRIFHVVLRVRGLSFLTWIDGLGFCAAVKP